MKVNVGPIQLRPRSPGAEMFHPPSREAHWLAKRCPRLLVPDRDGGPWLHRGLRRLMVAPFAQMTLLSFDLQMFLFDVMHTTRIARITHGLGMFAVNVHLAALVSLGLGPVGACVFAALLLAWYGATARSVGLLGWWLSMIPVVVALTFAGIALASLGAVTLAIGLACSAMFVAVGHLAEPTFPPRAGDPEDWIPWTEIIEGIVGRAQPLRTRLVWIARLTIYTPLGLLGELWASPRLLPHNVLRLLMAFGYAPKLRAVLDDRVERAWAAGNPALDFVGTGGGGFMVAEHGSS